MTYILDNNFKHIAQVRMCAWVLSKRVVSKILFKYIGVSPINVVLLLVMATLFVLRICFCLELCFLRIAV